MGKFTFDDMKESTVGGAIVGGILGSMFGDTAVEKTAGAIAGAIIGDYISDELEEPRTIVVHEPKVTSTRSYAVNASYFNQLSYEIDRDSMRIVNSNTTNSNKRNSLDSLKNRVRSAYYGDKISYYEANELNALIDSRRALCH